MRRLFTLLTALGLVSTLQGCHHTCGICDCEGPQDPCAYYAPCGHAALPVPIGGSAVAPTKDPGSPVMQKATEK